MRSAIEFGTSKIICVIEGKSKGGLDVPGLACVRYEGIRNGNIVDYEGTQASLSQAIETAEDRKKRQIRDVVVGVPGCFTKIEINTVKQQISGAVKNEDILKMASSAKPKAEKEMQLVDVRPAYFLDDKENLYVGMPTEVRTRTLTGCFSFFYADNVFLTEISNLINEMHIGIERFIPECIAQAMAFIPTSIRDESAILLDVGYYDTNLSMVYGDAILAKETLHKGAYHVVEEMAKRLHVELQTAESLKRSHVFGMQNESGAKVYGRTPSGKMQALDAKLVQIVLENSIIDLLQKITTSMQPFEQFITRKTPICLCGAGLAIREVAPFIQSKMARKVIDKTNIDERLSPVYHSAFALLDNVESPVYHLEEEQGSKPFFGRFFKK